MPSFAACNDAQTLQANEVPDGKVDKWRKSLPFGVLLLVLVPLFYAYFMRIHEMPTGLMNFIPFCSERFAEDGFAYHRFTPAFYDLWSDYSPTGYTVWYTHYPPLPFYLGGIIWMLGGTTKAALSLFFNAIALAYVLLFYRVFSLLLNRWIACISALALASHPLFVEQILENYLNLSLFFQSAAFLFLILALESPIRPKRYSLYLLAWVCLFGDAFSSFDQILASSFFVFAYTLWRLGLPRWRRVTRIVGAMATASISAFVLHLMTNAWFFGSFDAAFQDLCVSALQDKSLREIPFQDKIGLREYPVWLAGRVWLRYCMTVAGIASMAASLSWAFVSWRGKPFTRKYVVIAGIMLAANLAYWVIFSRLNYLQFDLTNGTQLLPAYSILLGGAIYFMSCKAWQYWTRPGFRKILIVIPEVLLLLCCYQVYAQVLRSGETMYREPISEFTQEIIDDPIVQFVEDMSGIVPDTSLVAVTYKSAFQHLLVVTPRSAFGLHDLPFATTYLKASDKNALHKLESQALVRDVFVIRKSPGSVSYDQRRESIVHALKAAKVPQASWEEVIADLTPIPVRPNWELVKPGRSYELYRVRTPERDDLFPHRASMPTRLAISGVRIRDGHELQLVGWIYTPERVNRIEILLNGETLGDAVYPAPGRELAEKSFAGMRQWFGMQDYPMPEEELQVSHPEYEDNTPRFIFIRRNVELQQTTQTIAVRAYSGARQIAEASYALEFVDGTLEIREYSSVVVPVDG